MATFWAVVVQVVQAGTLGMAATEETTIQMVHQALAAGVAERQVVQHHVLEAESAFTVKVLMAQAVIRLAR